MRAGRRGARRANGELDERARHGVGREVAHRSARVEAGQASLGARVRLGERGARGAIGDVGQHSPPWQE
jgi:hypothetical protein